MRASLVSRCCARVRCALPAALLFGLAAASATDVQAQSLRLIGADGDVTIEGRVLDGAAAFPARALTRLGATITDDVVEARVVVYDDTLLFSPGAPFFRSTAGVHVLALPVRRAQGELHLPEQFFLEWLPGRHGERIAWRSGALRTTLPLIAPGAVAPTERVSRVVVIDPGHGGRDAGKIGPNGVREKDVVLSIGLRLAGLLRERGYEVHMTRERDTLIALADRPRLANEWKQGRQRAVFLSIHANSWQPSVQGFETYFLSDARTEDARRVAEMENAAAQYDEDDSHEYGIEEMILNSLRNDFYVRASNDLAEVMQRGIAAYHEGPNRGVKQAGFRVLVGALMPAVLIETAYLSNPEEARQLARADFQQKLAYGIAEAVDNFFAQHEHLWTAGAP